MITETNVLHKVSSPTTLKQRASSVTSASSPKKKVQRKTNMPTPDKPKLPPSDHDNDEGSAFLDDPEDEHA
jgi:hypothetical protein